MRTRFTLPPVSDKKAVQAALRYYHDASAGEHQQHSFEWTRTHWFLQGVRKLVLRGQGEGQTPGPHYVDGKGQRRVRIEKALHLLQTEMGRVLSIDVGPAVERRGGVTLDGIRSSAIANASLDAFWSRFNSTNFRLAMAYMLVAYGTVGLGAFEAADDGGVYGVSPLTVPPWEMRPLPGGVTDVDQVSGVEWCRWVPLDWVKRWKHILSIPKSKKDMNLLEAPIGSKIQVDYAPQPSGNITGLGAVYRVPSPDSQEPLDKLDDVAVDHVEMKETWVYGDDYSCLRWSVMLGDHLALDVDYSTEASRKAINFTGNDLPIAPLHVARYLPVGSFWGRGLIDREINLNRELELAVGDLIQDARDSARTRIFMLPTSTGINLRQLENSYQRLQVMTYTPDYAAPSARPELMQPVPQTGQVLGQVVGMLNGFMDQTASQGPMYSGQAPGRVDSTGAIDSIRQAQEVPLIPMSESLTGAMVGFWKSTLGILRRRLKDTSDLTISRIDESLIGLVFDRETGTLTMADNPIPTPQSVFLTVRSKMPTSKQHIEEKLDKLLDKGLITPVQYRIAAFKHGLDLPFLSRAEYENYVSAWLDLATIVGDGKTPGKSFVNVEACNHPIHLAVCMELTSSPTYKVFSPAVRNAILQKKGLHLEQVGAFPMALENADQFGQVGPPSPDMMQMAMMQNGPPQPGQSPMNEMMGLR